MELTSNGENTIGENTMGEINKAGAGDHQSFVKLETVPVESRKVEEELVVFHPDPALTGDDPHQTTVNIRPTSPDYLPKPPRYIWPRSPEYSSSLPRPPKYSSSSRVMEFEDGPDIYNRFMTNVRTYITNINPNKDPKNPSNRKAGASNINGARRRDQSQSGFHSIPKDMLSPSTNSGKLAKEVRLLYQPATNANFRNISNLLKNMDGISSTTDLEKQSDPQLRHYYYHLVSYAHSSSTTIEELTEEAFSKREEIAKSWYPHDDDDDDDEDDDCLALLLASCFLNDMFMRYDLGQLSVMDDPECAHLWLSELWGDLLLLQNQIPLKFIGDGIPIRPIYKYFRDFLPLNFSKYIEMPYLPKMKEENYEANISEEEPSQTSIDHIRVVGTTIHPQDIEEEPSKREEVSEEVIKDRGKKEVIKDRGKKEVMKDRGKKFTITSTEDDPLHLLHVIHYLLLPGKREHRATVRSLFGCSTNLAGLCSRLMMFYNGREESLRFIPETMKPVPTATRLTQAGVKFRPVHWEGFTLEFKRGVLKLPFLHITKCTKKVLLNLIAWEKTHRCAPKYFINYAIFMDHLINTSKDVEILIESGVFQHSLPTDEAVAALFNGLGQNLVYAKDKRYDIFPKLSFDLNEYCQSRSNMWWANLMQEYFKSPWTIISVIAAMFLIMLTVAQTFFSAYSYFRPPK